MASKNRRLAYNFARTAFSFLCSPLDALWGLGKGTYYFFKSPHYWWAGISHFGDSVNQKDKPGTLTSATYLFNRILTVAAATICVLGFIGALVVPIPGIAPLYTAGVLGIAKAAGITIGWSTVSRAVGSFFGSIIDYFKLKQVENAIKEATQDNRPSSVSFLKMTVKASLFGEAIEEANKVLKWIGRGLARCFCKKGGAVNSENSPKESTPKKSGHANRPSSTQTRTSSNNTSYNTTDIYRRTTESAISEEPESPSSPIPVPLPPALQKTDSFGYPKSPAEENLTPKSQYCYESQLGSYVDEVTQFTPGSKMG